MMQFNNTNAGPMDNFIPTDYPVLSEEIRQITKDVDHTPIYYKSDIIISYLRDHSLKSEWIQANPVLAKLVLSGSLVTRNIEQLFDACRRNIPFRIQFEKYLKLMFN